ncbi:hypothetical protein V2J09_013261 [Rumex salicifolius]
MHVEKNVFNNVFNTVMDDRPKTKDHLNAWKDIKLYCNRPELHVDDTSIGKFPDGNASNLSRCVHIDEGRLSGMKSIDCHVFMERLLPTALKEFLPLIIWGSIAELSIFFQSICSSKLSVDHMKQLESLAPPMLFEFFHPHSLTLWNISWCTCHEAKIGGPPQYGCTHLRDSCII